MLHFNSSQQNVIELKAGQHVCLAPAGSGKTEVLTERISQALARGQSPQQMLCLTFTNQAGLHMRKKVEQRMGKYHKDLFIGNLHAFCFQLQAKLKKNIHQYLAPDHLQKKLIEHAFQHLNQLLNQPLDVIIEQLTHSMRQHDAFSYQHLTQLTPSHIQKAKQAIFQHTGYPDWDLEKVRRLILPIISTAAPHFNEAQKQIIRDRLKCLDPKIAASDLKFIIAYATYLNEVYTQLKSNYQLYDYDDLILQGLIYYSTEPLAQHYDWIQIDEVQDLSPLHWLLIEALKTPDAHILIFGDMNQSIYRFLGASLELTASKFSPNLHRLEWNYRNPANLVELSNEYTNIHFPKNYQIQAQAHEPHLNSALQWLERPSDNEQWRDIIQHIQQQQDQSLAILFSTNRQAYEFSMALNYVNISHFYVADPDLLSRPFFLDFLAFLQALTQPYQRMAWSRLLCRFGEIDQSAPRYLQGLDPEFAALQLSLQLEQAGCWLNNFIQIHDPYQHRQIQLCQAFHNDQLVYFDTETSGLDTERDDIIQIAAVSKTQSLDLYCHSDQDLTESSKIHQITAEILKEKAQAVDQQLDTFMQFSKNHAYVAHNLSFDHKILKHHLKRHLAHHVPAYQHAAKFCSLELSQQLFPHLTSYKLADLLQHFQLEGVNSHNALDDVKAGYQLLKHLVTKIESQQQDLEQVIEAAESCLMRFNQNFSPLWQLAQNQLYAEETCTIQQLFDLFFEYIKIHLPTLYANYAENDLINLRSKLFKHADEYFDPSHQEHYLNHTCHFYQTAKESDLISSHDRIIISTIHRSKGLEFDQVILPDLTDNQWPGFFVHKHAKSSDLNHQQESKQLLAEQKRLLYVALTRAKKKLIIGSFQHKATDKHPRHYQLTQFLQGLEHYFDRI